MFSGNCTLEFAIIIWHFQSNMQLMVFVALEWSRAKSNERSHILSIFKRANVCCWCCWTTRTLKMTFHHNKSTHRLNATAIIASRSDAVINLFQMCSGRSNQWHMWRAAAATAWWPFGGEWIADTRLVMAASRAIQFLGSRLVPILSFTKHWASSKSRSSQYDAL